MNRELPSQDAATASNRKIERQSIFAGEGISAELNWLEGSCAADVFDLTPTGIGVFIAQPVLLNVGDHVELTIHITGSDSLVKRTMVANIRPAKLGSRTGFKVGMCFLASARHTRPLQSTRNTMRLEVAPHFPPTAHCLDALYFQQYLFFRVDNFSKSGLCLATSLRNKSLIPGLKFNFKVLIPTQGEFDVYGQIQYARVHHSSQQLMVGLALNNPPQNYLEAVGEYLFSTMDYSLRQIRDAGFPMRQIERGLTFTYPTSQEDWAQILNLRLMAYHDAGKFSNVSDPEGMLDQYDPYARHVICKVHGKVVASGRVVFVNGDKSRSEHHNLGLAIPDWIWKENVSEFSRACTDPNYRGSDIFINLLRHFGRVAFQGGSRYIIANCNDNMWPMYQKTGFKKLGIRFDAFGTTGCNLIYVDLLEMLSGKSGKFLGWNQVVYPMARYIELRYGKKIIPWFRKILHAKLFRFIRSYRLRGKGGKK